MSTGPSLHRTDSEMGGGSGMTRSSGAGLRQVEPSNLRTPARLGASVARGGPQIFTRTAGCPSAGGARRVRLPLWLGRFLPQRARSKLAKARVAGLSVLGQYPYQWDRGCATTRSLAGPERTRGNDKDRATVLRPR